MIHYLYVCIPTNSIKAVIKCYMTWLSNSTAPITVLEFKPFSSVFCSYTMWISHSILTHTLPHTVYMCVYYVLTWPNHCYASCQFSDLGHTCLPAGGECTFLTDHFSYNITIYTEGEHDNNIKISKIHPWPWRVVFSHIQTLFFPLSNKQTTDKWRSDRPIIYSDISRQMLDSTYG